LEKQSGTALRTSGNQGTPLCIGGLKDQGSN
jgi:hypothetical protein